MRTLLVLIGFVLIFVLGIAMLSYKEDSYREKEVKLLKTKFISERVEKCMRAKDFQEDNATTDQQLKCEDEAASWWEEIAVMNSNP